jgi:threonine dehydrogenase-like Zn-dependent dehydrogenase
MKALVYHGPWDLTVESVPDARPGPGEVLVRVVATGICGSDIHGFTGENGRRRPGQVMGHETVGRVEALGEGVRHGPGLRPGAPVTINPLMTCKRCAACTGGREQSCPQRRIIGVNPEIVSAFADFLVAPAANVVALPEDMPLEYGALVEPLTVGHHAVRRGCVTSRDRVLVIGGGPIGQACLLAARRAGVEQVAVTEPNADRRALLGHLGVPALDPATAAVADAVPESLGGPATVVLDAVGSSTSLGDALACSTFGATVVLVGMGSPEVTLPAYALSTEERTLVGSFCYTGNDFRETAAWVGTSPRDLAPLIDGRVGMSDAPAAFHELGRGESTASKVLVYPAGLGGDG